MAVVSTELELQDITTLPKKTSSGMDVNTDFLLGVKENGVAYRADIEDLGSTILQGAKTNLIGKNQTVVSALRSLRDETNEKIANSYGAPLVANQASQMKDKTRVYVYTGNESGYQSGNWYYWNSSAWARGGVYNSGVVITDKSLSLTDYAADSKAVGDAISAINDDIGSVTDDVEQLQADVAGMVDDTLSISGRAADAKKTGDEITNLKADLSYYERNIIENKNLITSIKVEPFSGYEQISSLIVKDDIITLSCHTNTVALIFVTESITLSAGSYYLQGVPDISGTFIQVIDDNTRGSIFNSTHTLHEFTLNEQTSVRLRIYISANKDLSNAIFSPKLFINGEQNKGYEATAIDYDSRKKILELKNKENYIPTSDYIKPTFLIKNSYANANNISKLKDLPTNSCYAIHSDASVIEDRPSTRPSSFIAINPQDGVSVNPSHSVYDVYFCFDDNYLYYAMDFGNAKIQWKKVVRTSDLDSIIEDIERSYLRSGGLVNAQYVIEHSITQLRDLVSNRVYEIHSNATLNDKPENVPATMISINPSESGLIDGYRTYFYMTLNHCYFALDYNYENIKWNRLANYSDFISSNYERAFNLSATKKIVILGDSISHGVGSSDFSATGETITAGTKTTKRNVGQKSWAAQFGKLMSERYNCTCDNDAISGINMVEINDGIDTLITDDYDYAIIMAGTNDRYKNYNDFYNASYNLIKTVKDLGITPFVFSTIDVHVGAEDQRTFTTSPEMAQQAIRAAAFANQVEFFPMLSYWTSNISKSGLGYDAFYNDVTPETETASDGLHPNDRGYNLLFALFREFLNV